VTSILSLTGGVGGAKLVVGLAVLCDQGSLSIVVNTGDDDIFHGLHVSPDLDTVMYALSGSSDVQTGWGLEGETFHAMNALETYGVPTWFRLGDMDLATHILRTELLRQGYTLSGVTALMVDRLGITQSVIPMSDDLVRTIIITADEELSFQEYFVHRRALPVLEDLRFDGVNDSSPSPGFKEALESSDAIVFCPSNPIVSIGPILAIPGVADKISSFTGVRILVSPIIGGRAIKGPTVKMMTELGEEATSVGIARHYRGLVDVLIIDHTDAECVDEIQKMGMRTVVSNTVMATREDKIRLAGEVVRVVEE
jgi:LPPG:FO 2-phospho-L-lactate transferase